ERGGLSRPLHLIRARPRRDARARRQRRGARRTARQYRRTDTPGRLRLTDHVRPRRRHVFRQRCPAAGRGCAGARRRAAVSATGPLARPAAGDSRHAWILGTAFFLFSALCWGMNVPMTSRMFATWDPYFLSPTRIVIASVVLALL